MNIYQTGFLEFSAVISIVILFDVTSIFSNSNLTIFGNPNPNLTLTILSNATTNLNSCS